MPPYWILTVGRVKRVNVRRQILWRSVEPLVRYDDFRFFKMTAAALLDFQNLDFLTVKRVKRVTMTNVVTISQTNA